MTRTNKLDSNAVWFDGVYTLYVERDGCISHPMHFDTRGHGREVLRHAPQVVVMTMVGCLLGEARSTS